MLSENEHKKLETLTVELLLVLRGAYLEEQAGRPPMDYWSRIQNMSRAAARQTSSASEWCSAMQRRLQIPGFRNSGSKALIDLVRLCDEHAAHQDFLAMVERDSALLVALTQLIVEERKNQQPREVSL